MWIKRRVSRSLLMSVLTFCLLAAGCSGGSGIGGGVASLAAKASLVGGGVTAGLSSGEFKFLEDEGLLEAGDAELLSGQ